MVQLDNIDSLKSWLKGCLVQNYGWENDCESMIKYVVALLKKDLQREDLKKECSDQLSVFFNANTEKFIDELFAAVDSKAYLEEYSKNPKAPEEDKDTSTEQHPVAFIVDKKPDITHVVRERSQSRSKSPRRRSPRRYRSRSRSRDGYRQRKRSRSPLRRNRRYSRSRSPVRRSPSRDLRDTLNRKNNCITGRQRCRDFDEQGFCVRGEFCQFDHGSDPVILDSSDPYNPIRQPILNSSRSTPSSEYNPLLPAAEYDPLEHSNNRPYGWNYSASATNQPSSMARELVVVPRNVTPVLRASTHTTENFNRNRYQRGTELEVRKIPAQQNNIATLNEFFSKFGTVTNIQVNFQGYPENALVKFSKHQEALAAYRSTDAVLGNRFIRLFWHHGNQTNNADSGAPNAGGASANRSDISSNSLAAKSEPPKKIAKPNPEMLKKDNQAEKSKQLSTQKQQLVDKYTKEHEKLVAMLSKTQDDAKKEELQRMIKDVCALIEGLQGPPTPAKSSDLSSEIMTEKQLLDAELDLHRQIQEGNAADSKELMSKVAQLRKKARLMGLIDGSHTWVGKMAHKGLLLPNKTLRAPKPPLGQLQLDKRPKVIQVIAGDIKLPQLCVHFGRLAKLVNVQPETNEEGVKVFVFTFNSRKDAEVAVSRGGVFKGCPLKWSWIEQTTKDVKDEEVKKDHTSASPNLHEKKAEPSDVKPESKEMLAGDDEEEDEKSRSWRH